LEGFFIEDLLYLLWIIIVFSCISGF